MEIGCLLTEVDTTALFSADQFAPNSGAQAGGIGATRFIIILIPANHVIDSQELYPDNMARGVGSI